jgi:hypothetical protein
MPQHPFNSWPAGRWPITPEDGYAPLDRGADDHPVGRAFRSRRARSGAFSPLLFNKPGVAEDTFAGIPQGRMRLEQVVRLLSDVAGATDVVGLAITEHLPWGVLELAERPPQAPASRLTRTHGVRHSFGEADIKK